MAILDSEKVDFLWKRILYGVTKTANASTKLASNESISSPLAVLPTNIWRDAGLIPASAPITDTATVKGWDGAFAIRMTPDTTSPQYVTWLACSTVGQVSTRMIDFIPPTFGTSYAVKVYVGNPQAGGARIFPDATGQEWVFDYAAGVLVFTGSLPSAHTSGGQDITTVGIYIEVFQYTGAKGLSQQFVPFIPQTLGQLTDVEDGTGTPAQGAFLRWIDGVWQADVYQVNIPTPVLTLSGLTDVDLHTGLADGDVLTYQNGVWIPLPPAAGGVDPASLGTMAFQDADNVNITGGAITGVIIDGGTF
jgi:hypothetical protein